MLCFGSKIKTGSGEAGNKGKSCIKRTVTAETCRVCGAISFLSGLRYFAEDFPPWPWPGKAARVGEFSIKCES